MRIANNVAFGTISYILAGDERLNIKFRRMGYWKEDIFFGTLDELREKKYVFSQLESMKVNHISVDNGVLLIGVDKC